MDGETTAAACGPGPGTRLALTHMTTAAIGRACVLEATPALLVVKPLRHSGTLSCDRGDFLQVSFAMPGDARYSFESTVLRGGEDRWELAAPAAVARVQLRQHTRVEVDAELDGKASTGRIVDVSAGGIGVLSGADWPLGAVVRARYTIPSQSGEVCVDSVAEVVRRTAVIAPGSGGSSCLFGLAHRGLPEAAQDAIAWAVHWATSKERASALQ